MRNVVSFLIGAGLFYLFIRLGWLIPIEADTLALVLLLSGIFSVINWVVWAIFAIAWMGMTVVSIKGFLIGCLIFPLVYALIGAVLFAVINLIFPNTLVVNATFLQVMAMGVLLAVIDLPAPSNSSAAGVTA